MDVKSLTLEGLDYFKEKQDAFNDSKFATKASIPTVDAELSSTSTNPVQNKVVKTALDGKAESSHTHSDATGSTSGFMSAADKTKLDSLENADMTGYMKVLRNASGTLQDDKGYVDTVMITADPMSGTNFVQIRADGDQPTFAMNTMEVNGFTDTIGDDADGYMLATDKAVKSYVDANATKITVDSALSDDSTNPVQNKVIKSALDGKAASNHTHDDRYYTETEVDSKLESKANVSHTHDASNIASGTFDAARIPTITDDKIQNVSATKLVGTVPSENLPSYVDDVVEYENQSSFPPTGEAGKIYVDTTTNKTYRWGGSNYVEISASLALGTTSSTAFRGDYGNAAYQHAVANKGSAFASGLYKITTNAEGHVTAATAVTKSDITALGIPEQDTNTTYENATTDTAGLMSATDKAKLDGIAEGADKLPEGGTAGQVLTKTEDGEEWQDTKLPDDVVTIDKSFTLSKGETPLQMFMLEASDSDCSQAPAVQFFVAPNGANVTLSKTEDDGSKQRANIVLGGSSAFMGVSSTDGESDASYVITLNADSQGAELRVNGKSVSSITDAIEASPAGNALVTDKAVADYIAANIPETPQASDTQYGTVKFASDEDFKAYMGIS